MTSLQTDTEMSPASIITKGCGACETEFQYIEHAQWCPIGKPDFQPPTAESIKAAEENARKKEEDLAAAKKEVKIENLTYNIIDNDRNRDSDGIYDKEITVQLIDGEEEVVAEWVVYFNLADAPSSGAGDERRFYRTAHLGAYLDINEVYQGLKLSRFMGKLLADKIVHMISVNKLRRDDLFWISGDVAGGFWESIGMGTVSDRGHPHKHFEYSPADDDDKWCLVGDFIDWAYGTKEGTKPNSIVRLKHLLSVIKEHIGKKSSPGGGRKKRTRKKIKRKRRKTRRKSKKKRKRKTRKK